MDELATELIARERAALDRWIAGDTQGFAELCDRDVTYFDTNAERRIDGLDALQVQLARYAELIGGMLKQRGATRMDRHEMRNARVQRVGDMAVLSYDWEAHLGTDVIRWRATEVYRLTDGQWRIVHAHWSAVQPPAARE